MIFLLLKEFLSFFKKYVIGKMSFTNKHLLVLGGHGTHVTLETIDIMINYVCQNHIALHVKLKKLIYDYCATIPSEINKLINTSKN
jgi:hypothetical protein